MKVYIVFEVVDLGDHVVSVHHRKDDAEHITANLQNAAMAQYGVTRCYYWCDEYDVE